MDYLQISRETCHLCRGKGDDFQAKGHDSKHFAAIGNRFEGRGSILVLPFEFEVAAYRYNR